jgi:hypothetical protein
VHSVCKAHARTSNADTAVFRPPREAELLSESKELNVNFQDPESFLADPDPHDLMRIRPRHPNGHFGACIRLVYVPPVYVSGFRWPNQASICLRHMYWGVIDPEGGRFTNNILLQGRLKICDQLTDLLVC